MRALHVRFLFAMGALYSTACDPGWGLGVELSVQGPVTVECLNQSVESVDGLSVRGVEAGSVSFVRTSDQRIGFINIDRQESATRVTLVWGALGSPPDRREGDVLFALAREVSRKIPSACKAQKVDEKSFCQSTFRSRDLCGK